MSINPELKQPELQITPEQEVVLTEISLLGEINDIAKLLNNHPNRVVTFVPALDLRTVSVSTKAGEWLYDSQVLSERGKNNPQTTIESTILFTAHDQEQSIRLTLQESMNPHEAFAVSMSEVVISPEGMPVTTRLAYIISQGHVGTTSDQQQIFGASMSIPEAQKLLITLEKSLLPAS